MFASALSGAASFAACLSLFRCYPLAVSSCRGNGWQRSMVLRHDRGFFVLSQDADVDFVLRPWGRDTGERRKIRPAEPVPASVHEVITEGMPIPRDGALLGWVTDHQVSVLLSVYHGHPGGQRPRMRVLPAVGSDPLHWPPFTVRPLDDGYLWQYLDRGQLADLAPLLARSAGRAFWVPSQNQRRAVQAHGCVVIRQDLAAGGFWLPAGVYMDHWMLREGVPAPPPAQLLALPGTVELSRRLAAT